MNKKALTEADIRTKFITPALVGANGDKWNVMTQILEEACFTKGRVIVRGRTVKRSEAKKADYILSYRPNLPLAVVEAKDNNHAVGAGMHQEREKQASQLARASLACFAEAPTPANLNFTFHPSYDIPPPTSANPSSPSPSKANSSPKTPTTNRRRFPHCRASQSPRARERLPSICQSIGSGCSWAKSAS